MHMNCPSVPNSSSCTPCPLTCYSGQAQCPLLPAQEIAHSVNTDHSLQDGVTILVFMNFKCFSLSFIDRNVIIFQATVIKLLLKLEMDHNLKIKTVQPVWCSD